MTTGDGRNTGRAGSSRPGLRVPVRPGGGARAAAIDARQDDGMRGPKIMAGAVAAFFGSCVLAVHLMYLPGSPAAATSAPRIPPAAIPVPAPLAAASPAPAVPIVVAARPPAADPPEGGDEEGFALSLNLGVAPVPPPAVPGDRERKVIACVEGKVRESGQDDVKPTLPGRWPALKRAREEKRLRRLEARVACERELSS